MDDEYDNQVVVVDVRIPFWSMVWLLVKMALAAIPAAIILAFVFAFFAEMFR